jgi:hypothetical protein
MSIERRWKLFLNARVAFFKEGDSDVPLQGQYSVRLERLPSHIKTGKKFSGGDDVNSRICFKSDLNCLNLLINESTIFRRRCDRVHGRFRDVRFFVGVAAKHGK